MKVAVMVTVAMQLTPLFQTMVLLIQSTVKIPDATKSFAEESLNYKSMGVKQSAGVMVYTGQVMDTADPVGMYKG